MELPLGGPALRHYTQSRPRPHRQKLNYRPSRPQETIIESENEVPEFMGRVDEGVEEFFTKRVLPTDTLKKQDEESITVHEVAPASSVPCPPPTKTLRRKLGDFFTLKKRRALKSETSQEGRPKKASIADFIRPLRDKEKDKERVKEHDKENENEKVKEHPIGVAGETAVQESPVSGVPPLRGEAVPPRRALREGKSQSLILLSGSAAAGTNARNIAKKQFEGQHSFEQKLHLMLQRIGVSKAHPGETQNQEGEMKKAESEGTIIDSKPEPPPTFTKPRTMSASSDTRHQIRPSVSDHESAGKPALLPKPVLKPGPPTTTSGRNTPENELAQIEEGETHMPAKPSPIAAPSTPDAPGIIATAPPSLPTASNSVPDSTDFSISHLSTVPPPDTDICTDSFKSTAAATIPSDAEPNNKPCIPEASTSELPASGTPKAITDITTPTGPATTPSEPITPSLCVTSHSATPSATTLETIPAATSESLISTTSAKATCPEPNGDLSVDASDDAPTIITAASPPSSVMSDTSPTASSVTEASDQSASGNSTSSVTLISSKRTSLPSDASITIAPDTSSSSALPPTSSTSLTITITTSPTSADSICASTFTHTAIPVDVSSPSTSSSETNPTDTTTTTASLNCADTTSTTSSATTAAVNPPLPSDSTGGSVDNVNTSLTPTVSSIPTADNTSATSQHLTSPAPRNDSPDQDTDSQRPLKDRSSDGVVEKGAADEVLQIGLKRKQTETDEGGKENEKANDKPILVNSDVTRKPVQEETMKAEEDVVTTEVAELASGKDGEIYGAKK